MSIMLDEAQAYEDSSHRRLPASEMLWVMNGRRTF